MMISALQTLDTSHIAKPREPAALVFASTAGATEAQRGKVSLLKLHSVRVTDPGLKPGHLRPSPVLSATIDGRVPQLGGLIKNKTLFSYHSKLVLSPFLTGFPLRAFLK